jgi:cytochrome c5
MLSKKFFVMSMLILIVAFASQSFSYIQRAPGKLKNIKAFPATMTYDEVDHQMDIFKVALGVKCNHCHAQTKESAPKLDMSSDDNPKKDIAREMIRMTRDLNEKYMAQLSNTSKEPLQEITCNTCHRGNIKPEDKVNLDNHRPERPSQGPSNTNTTAAKRFSSLSALARLSNK